VNNYNPLLFPSFNPLAIPATNCLANEFYQFDNWNVWEELDDKKKPYCADRYYRSRGFDGYKLTYLDHQHQRFFNVASQYLSKNRQHFKGLGFVLRLPYAQNCAYTCIDLDWKKHNPPLPTPFQQSVINACIGRTYIEYSPSGLGIHIWCRGSAGGNFKRPEIEIYSHSRFMTITFAPLLDTKGNVIGNVPFAEWETLLPMLPQESLAMLAGNRHFASCSVPKGG
jgi:primase-polymerase (primpol)-like protein